MGYIQDFETRIRVILDGYVAEELLEKALRTSKDAVIESYKNGIEEGRRGERPPSARAPQERARYQKPAPQRKPAWKKRR